MSPRNLRIGEAIGDARPAAAVPSIGEPVALRDAATVLLVRDGADDALEVFMLRRNLRSDFVGGAYVFPGGAVDPDDRARDLEGWCRGRTDADASTRLGVPRGGLAFWAAAIRESLEESGYLLAYDDDELVSLTDPDVAARFAAHRRAVDRGERTLISVCEEEGLRLAVDTMWYFGHWITPEGSPRRYDTRFFLAAAPPQQTPVHDDREVIASLWISPAEALERHAAGDLAMLPPTVASLRALEASRTAAEALTAAAELVDVPTVQPRVISDQGGVRIVMPGDAEYDSAYRGDRALGRWPSVDDRSARA